MLCDDIVANGAPGSGSDISCLLPVLRSAQKYILAPEFAAVAEALSQSYTGLVKAFPFCRLPYPVTWIEMAHLDRPRFAGALTQAPRFQATPSRVGYLLRATRPDLSAWKAHLFWRFEQDCSCAGLAMQFDMLNPLGPDGPVPTDEELSNRIERSAVLENITSHPGWCSASAEVKRAMLAHVEPCFPDYPPPALPLDLSRAEIERVGKVMVELARSDWSGEPAYMLSVIGLLNARNVVAAEEVDHTEYNRKRAKRGRLPLFSHRVLRISRRQIKRTSGAPGATGDYAVMRGHFVTGHWKVRRSGIYFWRPHARGHFARGTVHKTYEVVR